LWKVNVWNLTRSERWRESIESFCLYGFELRDINGTLIRCDQQSREHWGQVTIVVPSLVTFEECVKLPWFFGHRWSGVGPLVSNRGKTTDRIA